MNHLPSVKGVGGERRVCTTPKGRVIDQDTFIASCVGLSGLDLQPDPPGLLEVKPRGILWALLPGKRVQGFSLITSFITRSGRYGLQGTEATLAPPPPQLGGAIISPSLPAGTPWIIRDGERTELWSESVAAETPLN